MRIGAYNKEWADFREGCSASAESAGLRVVRISRGKFVFAFKRKYPASVCARAGLRVFFVGKFNFFFWPTRCELLIYMKQRAHVLACP